MQMCRSNVRNRVTHVIKQLLKPYACEAKTMPLDKVRELLQSHHIDQVFGLQALFADPYKNWGTIEKLNGFSTLPKNP